MAASVFINIRGADQLFHQTQLIVGIKDGEVGFQPHQFGVTAQQFGADRVERAQPWHGDNLTVGQLFHADFHFAGRFIGEGHGKNIVGPRSASRQQVPDTRGQRLGFAGARTRKHQNRAVHRLYRLALRGVQSVKIPRVRTPRHRPLAKGNGGGLEGVIFTKSCHGFLLND